MAHSLPSEPSRSSPAHLRLFVAITPQATKTARCEGDAEPTSMSFVLALTAAAALGPGAFHCRAFSASYGQFAVGN